MHDPRIHAPLRHRNFILILCMCRDTGEAIEVLALPLNKSQEFMDADLNQSAGLLFGLLWLRMRQGC